MASLREQLFGKKRTAEEEYSFEEKLTTRTNASSGGLDLLGTFDESKMKRYQYAMDKKAIIFDKEDSEGVDYAHMDFVLSTGCGFYNGMTNLQAIKLFWRAFYPYLKTLAESYERFYDQFRAMIDDQEDVLAKHAEIDFRFKWTKEWIKQNVDKKAFKQYETFLHNKVHEAKMKNPAPEKRAVDELPEVKQ